MNQIVRFPLFTSNARNEDISPGDYAGAVLLLLLLVGVQLLLSTTSC